jgi:hypothetical protein
MVQLNFSAARGLMMPRLQGAFPQQSEIDSVTEQLPSERLPDFVASILMTVPSKQQAELMMYRERPSEAGRRRLLAMGVPAEEIDVSPSGTPSRD